MGVSIRENVKESGTRSLYLDIYHNGKRYKEYLGLHLKAARTIEERNFNKETKRLAEKLRAERELQLQEIAFNLTPTIKKNQDFIEYYQNFVDNYKNKDNRIVTYGFIWFKKFLESKGIKKLKLNELTNELCQGYVEHMQNNGLRGDTPSNYWTKFKMVVRKAIKEKLIAENPTEGIRVVRSDGLKKEILTQDEIQIMAKAKCSNSDIKRAFLFSCFSGLRWCDVNVLKHGDIDRTQGHIIFTQSKTRHSSVKSQVIIPLTPTLLTLIGEVGKSNQMIFNLPSFSGAMGVLKFWAIVAKVNKNITWHSARHSFAVNLLGDAKADIKTVADLLGHSGLKHTEKYLHVVDARKKTAMNNLIELQF